MFNKSENQSLDDCLLKLKDSSVRKGWLLRMADSIRDIWVYSATDDDTGSSQGFAIVITHHAGMELARLLHLFVEEPFRGQGIGSGLLSYIIHDLSINLISHLNGYVIKDTDRPDLFLKHGFRLRRSETNLIYEGDTLLNSKISAMGVKLDPLISRVLGVDELSMDKKADFNKRLKERGVEIDIRKTDDELTRYYMTDGQVSAYMAFRRDRSGGFVMSDFFADPKLSDKYAIPAMISSLLKDYDTEISGHDVMLDFFSEANVQAMLQGFGSPRVIVKTDAYLLNIE